MSLFQQSQAMEHHLASHFNAVERAKLNTVRLLYVDLLRDICLFEDAVMDKSTLIDAQIFRLPSFTDEDIGQEPTTIEVTPSVGEAALASTLTHLHALEQEYDHSARIIKRLPGIIALSHPEPDSLRARMFQINLKKAEFQKTLFELCPEPNQRFELLMTVMPNVVKLKVFRDILFANRLVYSVGFSWKHRKAVTKFGKHQLLEVLERNLKYYEQRYPLSEKVEMIRTEKQIISRYPASSRFVQSRPLRVAPAMNINYEKGAQKFIESEKAPVDKIAHSPLFIFNQSLKVHPLKPYDIEQARKSQETTMELVLPRLSIYFDNIASKEDNSKKDVCHAL